MQTNQQLETAAPREKAYQIPLGGGLLLEVKPTGAKVFYCRYRIGGKGHKLKIGDFPALSLEAAQKIHSENRAAVAAGNHPETRKDSEPSTGGFATFVPPYLATFKEGNHKAQRERYITRYLLPPFAERTIDSITAKEIFPVLDDVKNRRGVAVALLCHAILKGVFSQAIYRGFLVHNPLLVIPTKSIGKPRPRDTIFSLDQLQTVMSSANSKGATGTALRLIILTLCRKTEVSGARWEEVDFAQGVWRIPAERMKGRRDHLIPLTPLIISELLNLCNGKPEAAKGWLFPSPYKTGVPIADSTLNHALRKIIPGKTVHDLRRSGSTLLADKGYPAEVIEAALAHTTKGIRAHYIHASFLPARMKMLEEYGKLLTA